jgi:hypothetical protein
MIVVRVTASTVPGPEPIPTGIITLGILNVLRAGAFGAMTSFHGPGFTFIRLHRHGLHPLDQQGHKKNQPGEVGPLAKEGSSSNFHKRLESYSQFGWKRQ